MPIELAPCVGAITIPAGGRCVCNHGPLWHVAPGGGCDANSCGEPCGCHRYRAMVKTDGNRDGIYSHGEMVTDHPHDPAGGWWWSRCVACGLGEAAHMATTGAGDRP